MFRKRFHIVILKTTFFTDTKKGYIRKMIKVWKSNFSGKYSKLNDTCWTDIDISRLKLTRSIMTVGYNSIVNVYKSGLYRLLELMFKSLGNIESKDNYIRLSEQFWKLDDSEKRIVSYYIGQGLTKALAECTLHIPWLVHISKNEEKIVLHKKGTVHSKIKLHNCSKKPKAPDLLGIDKNSNPHIFEAKGYSSGFNASELQHAINQVSQVITVNSMLPETKVACFFDMSGEKIEGTIVDPPSEMNKKGIFIKTEIYDLLNLYYSMFNSYEWDNSFIYTYKQRKFNILPVGINFYFGIDHILFKQIKENSFNFEVLNKIVDLNEELDHLSIGSDGVILIEGLNLHEFHLKDEAVIMAEVDRLLKQTGKAFFIENFAILNDLSLSVEETINKLTAHISTTSKIKRVYSARRLFYLGLEEKALRNVINSKKIDQKTKKLSEQIISDYLI